MKYYVVADVHGFFSELKLALTEKGFFNDKEPHKLIMCGDLLDRGTEALEVQSFILDLMKKVDNSKRNDDTSLVKRHCRFRFATNRKRFNFVDPLSGRICLNGKKHSVL